MINEKNCILTQKLVKTEEIVFEKEVIISQMCHKSISMEKELIKAKKEKQDIKELSSVKELRLRAEIGFLTNRLSASYNQKRDLENLFVTEIENGQIMKVENGILEEIIRFLYHDLHNENLKIGKESLDLSSIINTLEEKMKEND